MHRTREIPREAWEQYLSAVSRYEQAHLVRIEAGSPEWGEQAVAGRLPLVDIALEKKGSEAGVIAVTVGRPGEEITHRIPMPDHLYADEDESGELECLDIESSGHVKTLIFFEPSLGSFADASPSPW